MGPEFGGAIGLALWAVYDFLQDQLGCRWIWSGDLGRVVPKRKTVGEARATAGGRTS
ncbi:MAG: hypothetical protein GW911_33200 [Armatimonadetes bacterium]|nr:hypothetical protein [Armatimonadota bacterium]NDK16910.1 hypothetical protein [Armatimonadota bacterium]